MLRDVTADDLPFIYNSWLKSFKSSPWAKSIPTSIYYANHKEVIAKILPKAIIMVACNPEDQSQIFGYAVFTPGRIIALHYVYVKQPYRRLGIAQVLFEFARASHMRTFPMIATHVTDVWSQVLRDKWSMIYNPYLLEVLK